MKLAIHKLILTLRTVLQEAHCGEYGYRRHSKNRIIPETLECYICKSTPEIRLDSIDRMRIKDRLLREALRVYQ